MAPKSTPKTPAAVNGPVSLPLFKLSHCTTASPRSPMLWTHLPNRDDMFAVFDVLRRRTLEEVVIEKKVLKLVRGGELLEQIELDMLQRQGNNEKERAKSQQVRYDDLHVLVLVKAPLLALRYQLPDGQIRKIQMNFQQVSDCDIAFSTFNSIGLPTQDKNQTPSQTVEWRPLSLQAAMPSSSRPRSHEQKTHSVTTHDDVRSCTQPMQTESRPPSAGQSSSQSRPQEHTDSLAAAYDLVRASAQLTQVQSRPTSARPSSSQSLSQEQPGVLNNTAYRWVPPSTQQRPNLSRPASASIGLNQDDFSRPIPFIRDPRTHLERSTSGPVVSCNTAARPNSSSDGFGSSLHPTVAPALPPGLIPSPELGSQSSAVGYTTRPISAPQTQAERSLTDSLTLSQMLPPKRILPFPEKNEKPTSQASNATTVGESHAEGPKSKEPDTKAAKETKGRAHKTKTKSSRHKANLLTPEPSSSASNLPTKKTLLVTLNAGKPPSSSAPSKTSSLFQETARNVSQVDASLAVPSTPPVLNAHNKRPLTTLESSQSNGRQVQTHEALSSSATQQPASLFDSVLSSVTPAELLDSVDGWIRKYNSLTALPKPPQSAKEHLGEYAKHSDEERAKAIDNLICECLQDENFGKLVEDVEGAWRRIGLGF